MNLVLLALALFGCSGDEAPPPPNQTLPTDSASTRLDTAEETGVPDSGTRPTDSDPTDSDPITPSDLIAVVGLPSEEVWFLVPETGEVVAQQRIRDWLPDKCAKGDCRLAGFQHEVIADEDVMTFAYSIPEGTDGARLGGIVSTRLGSPGSVLWELMELDFDTWLSGIYDGRCAEGNPDSRCRMANPHTVVRMPDRRWLIADTAQDRLLILEPEPEELSENPSTSDTQERLTGEVRQVMDETTQTRGDWQECEGPNNAEIWVEDDVTYALMTCRGSTTEDGGRTRQGSISLWDLRDLDRPTRIWRYPERGFLKAVHHGRVIDGPDSPWLVYGHSMGNSTLANEELGTVGIARFSLTEVPEYLGDGQLPEEVGELGFVRSVGPLPDGQGMLVADSGCEVIAQDCQETGRLIQVRFPDRVASGRTGSWSDDHGQQDFFALDILGLLEGSAVGGLPYEAEYLPAEALGVSLRTPGAVTPAD